MYKAKHGYFVSPANAETFEHELATVRTPRTLAEVVDESGSPHETVLLTGFAPPGSG
ncbi:hypothetical protein [Streptomyces sp. NPDC004266]|uniref:hypothetical protein n=1 Tax=Streptomyces sp. NPDC004266 TaxID=3364693 RepID=UPI0036BF2E02